MYRFFFAKSKQLKALGKLGIIPALFGINEPILFGAPVVMNPMLAIPDVYKRQMYDSKSAGAESYRNLAKEIIARNDI